MKVTFVGDPNLGNAGLKIVSGALEVINAVFWKKGDAAGKKEARKQIRGRPADVCISFYSDLVLLDEELAAARMTLNIHPALPEVPGLGYDTLPLIESHPTHGATLHFVEPSQAIDSGKVIDVEERPLPAGLTYLDLRRRNQEACLELLRRTVHRLAECPDPDCAKAAFEKCACQLNRCWAQRYIDSGYHSRLLIDLYQSDPNHPALIGHPAFQNEPCAAGSNADCTIS